MGQIMDNTDGVKNGLLYGQQDSLCSVVEVLATEASRGRVELRPGCGGHPLLPLKRVWPHVALSPASVRRKIGVPLEIALDRPHAPPELFRARLLSDEPLTQ